MLMTDDVIRGIPFLSLDAYLPLVLTLTAAVPAADAVPEGRKYLSQERSNRTTGELFYF